MAARGMRPVADQRTERFLGKVTESTARCRGGDRATMFAAEPWVDWQNYWAAGDVTSRAPASARSSGPLDPNTRGIDGALLDLEYQRVELIKFNLFDNSGTYAEYVRGRDGVPGPALKVWDAMRSRRRIRTMRRGRDGTQLCTGELIRFRNLTGICNDIRNPLMGSTGQPFARNVQFESTFPELGNDELARNRHGGRLGLLQPDPQVISRKLFTREQSQPDKCNEGRGLPGHSADANCDYKKAPFFNVLAAFWIQFMTHDWFSHLSEGHNEPELMPIGCASQRVGNVERPLTPERFARSAAAPEIAWTRLCRAGRRPPTFTDGAARTRPAPSRRPRTPSPRGGTPPSSMATTKLRAGASSAIPTTAPSCCWSRRRRTGAGDRLGYLPLFDAADPINPDWSGRKRPPFPTTGRSA